MNKSGRLPAIVEPGMTPEVLVCGAGIAGCLAALAAADAGLRVAVAEKRSYPGREVAAYNHSFVRRGGGDRVLRTLPDEMQRLLSIVAGEEVLAPEGFVRQGLLRMLERRNIPVLFEAEPAGLTVSGRVTGGVVLATPPGLAWLPAAAVLDATERSQVLRLAKGIPYLTAGTYAVHAVFEWEMTPAAVKEALALPPEAFAPAARELGLAEGSIRMHPTLRADTLATEFAFPATVADPSCHSLSLLEEQRQDLSLRLGVWLRERVGTFAEASLSFLAYECRPSGHELPPDTDGGYDNLFAVPGLPWGFSLDDVAAVWAELPALVARLPRRSAPASPEWDVVTGAAARTTLAALKPEPYPDAGLPVDLRLLAWDDSLPVPESRSCDLCVAGFGTAGGTAVAAAAERGVDVVAVDLLQLPGGTFAPGRVHGLYGGYRGGVFGRFVSDTEKQDSAKLHAQGAGGINYSEYLRAAARGAAVYGGSRLCGAKRDGGRITELLFANESGLFVLRPRVAVDATGNADIAALAGADFDLGDPRDGMQQSFSMWGTETYASGNWLSTRYSSDPDVASPTVYSERLRAISLGHRGNSYHHISPIATFREGRRIRGSAGLTVNDILNRRLPADVVAVATTTCDSHAHLSSDLAAYSVIGGSRYIRVRIPLGCLVPQGLENLLVGAKALSGERDATSLCRMNADLVNQGYAMGCAAVAALAAGGRIRDIDLATLQAGLRDAGILPDWAFRNDAGEPEAVADEVLPVAGLDRLQEMLTFSAAEARPLLEARWARLAAEAPDGGLSSERLAVCLALGWYGSAVGGDRLRETLERAIGEKRHLTLPPMAPERLRILARRDEGSDFFQVNRLLVMAGLSGAGGFTAALARLVEETPGAGEPVARLMPYDTARKDVPVHPFHHRLKCLAFAVERHPDPLLIPAMDGLLGRVGVGADIVPLGSFAEPSYMSAYLGLCMAGAAFRCGSRVGEEILVRYMDDTHCFFREHARRLLRKVSGDTGH